MDRGMVIFVGALLTFSSSWLGLILYPYWQLNNEQPYQKDSTDEPYPQPLQGQAIAGRKVYQADGCMYCHSQQVRSEKFGNWWDENGQHRTGADIKRGWGQRRNVSRDYLYDNPTMLGTMRTGPDLANIGSRYSETWQHTHLFNARTLNDWSIMPSFAFLYTQMQNGAFASTTPKTAFVIDVSDGPSGLNTPAVVASGQLIAEYGLAMNTPAEWGVIRVRKDTRALDAMSAANNQ